MGKKVPKRRAWRKAKIEDVEEAIEDERLVSKLKRTGPKPKGENGDSGAAEEEGDELFIVDTKGSCEGLSAKTRRELARAKLFPPKAPRLGLSASEEAKVAKAGRSLGAFKISSKDPEVFDLWGSAPASSSGTSSVQPPLSEEFSAIRRRKVFPASTPKTLHQKVGKAPAVVPAHEGQSMNPELKAYEDLAYVAAARELERERENEELDRKMRPMTHELRDAADAEALKEMSEEAKVNMYRSIVCSTSLQGDSADAFVTPGQRARRQKKQKSQSFRNRAKKLKGMAEEERRRQAQRKLVRSVGEVGAILKDMKDQSDLQKDRKQYRESLKSEKRKLEESQGIVPKRRKLGRAAFTEETIVVPDAEAAAKGLRAMPLRGGTAIHDRVSSIMRRGLLPALPETSKSDIVRRSKKAGRLKRMRKFISPLLRDNLLK